MQTIFGSRFRVRRWELFGRLSYPVQTLVGTLNSRRGGAVKWERDFALPSRRRLFRACSGGHQGCRWAVLFAAHRTAQATRASLLAAAVITTFTGDRRSRASSHGPNGDRSRLTRSTADRAPSTSSFRSAANAAAHAQNSQPPSGLSSWGVREKQRRELSSTSLTSDRSALSPRSSMSSDHNPFVTRGHTQGASAISAQGLDQAGGTTDPTIIHAITQTMIGEFLYKYTRRAIGKGHGEKRHKQIGRAHV